MDLSPLVKRPLPTLPSVRSWLEGQGDGSVHILAARRIEIDPPVLVRPQSIIIIVRANPEVKGSP
jgi:hypothetical protein